MIESHPSHRLHRHTRRDLLKTAAAGSAAAAALAMGADPLLAAQAARAAAAAQRSGKPLRAAFSNIGLAVSWCAQGKAAAEHWGRLYNVEVTWFDGQLDLAKQRDALNQMAAQRWDFVAVQPFAIDALVEPVQKMIDAGIPVIDMDTLIAPPDKVKVHTFLAPDNEFMGAAVTQALVTRLGGKGKVIETAGALGHTGAQGRAAGFNKVVKEYPGIEVLDTSAADWDVAKVKQIWEGHLEKYPQIDAAFFHNDDMALAAFEVIERRGRAGKILIGGVDAMPPAIAAVTDGRMFATVRNPSSRTHGYSIVAGVAAAAAGATGGEAPAQPMPRRIVLDSPLVTQANAAGMRWMQEQFLI